MAFLVFNILFSEFMCLSTVTSEVQTRVKNEVIAHYTEYLGIRRARKLHLPKTSALSSMADVSGPELVLDSNNSLVI